MLRPFARRREAQLDAYMRREFARYLRRLRLAVAPSPARSRARKTAHILFIGRRNA